MSLSDLVVVMRLGRIEQIGPPQAIYNHPRSLFVARFMGYTNRLPVTLLGKDGNFWQVQTATGVTLRASSTNEAEASKWQPGQNLVVSMRPDETLIDPLLASNRLRGRVQLVEYVGRAFESLVRLEGDGSVEGTQLLVHSESMPATDSAIDFGVRPERLLLFAEDETPGNLVTSSASSEAAVKAER
jgi:putative spermidine/putrescine transport system ATP-binding protein